MRPLRTYRISALVLRIRNFGEADRMLTLLSAERGKVTALAKGARRAKSKLASLQMFSLANLQMAVGKNFDVITQAIIRLPYSDIQKDVPRFAYASYCCELADALSDVDHKNLQLFDALVSTLARLNRGEDAEMLARIFELRSLDIAGYGPEIDTCINCGQALGMEPMSFSPQEGGLMCARCRPNVRGLMQVHEATRQHLLTVRALRELSSMSEAHLSAPEPMRKEMQTLLMSQIEYHVEKRLKSLDALKKLK